MHNLQEMYDTTTQNSIYEEESKREEASNGSNIQDMQIQDLRDHYGQDQSNSFE